MPKSPRTFDEAAQLRAQLEAAGDRQRIEKPTALPPDEAAEVARRFVNGEPLSVLCAELGLHRTTAIAALKSAGLKLAKTAELDYVDRSEFGLQSFDLFPPYPGRDDDALRELLMTENR